MTEPVEPRPRWRAITSASTCGCRPVEAAGNLHDVDGAVRDAKCTGIQVPNLTGGDRRDAPNHTPDQAGPDRRDPGGTGKFDIKYSQTEPVAGDALTDFLAESAVTGERLPGLGSGMYKNRDADLRADRIELTDPFFASRWPPDRGPPAFFLPGSPHIMTVIFRRDAGPVAFCSLPAQHAQAQEAEVDDLQSLLQAQADLVANASRRSGSGAGHAHTPAICPRFHALVSAGRRASCTSAAATACSSTWPMQAQIR